MISRKGDRFCPVAMGRIQLPQQQPALHFGKLERLQAISLFSDRPSIGTRPSLRRLMDSRIL